MNTIRLKRYILLSGICMIALFVRSEPNAGPLLKVCSRWSASLVQSKSTVHASGSGQASADTPDTDADNLLSSSAISTNIGTLAYYSQSDPRWGSYLYGGCDPLYSSGCGPAALAMIVNKVTPMIPSQMAKWASDRGYWFQGQGSAHQLIPDCLSSFGFHVEGLTDTSPGSLKASLSSGNILVLLMGPGHFTDNGHFILLTGINEDETVRIADPNSLDNTQLNWDVSLISDELSRGAAAGGPAWAVSIPD